VESEIIPWVQIYHQALAIAGSRGGVVPKILRCIHVFQEMGAETYLKWFRTQQTDFDGLSPGAFFIGNGWYDFGPRIKWGRASEDCS
jgi:hypothetical protein